MATAKSTNKKVVALNPDVSEQIQALREDVALLASAVKVQTKTKVADTTSTVKTATTEKAEMAKAKYDEITSQAETSIKENPLTSVAIAAGAGLLLGAILRR